MGFLIFLGASGQDQAWYHTHKTSKPDQLKLQPAKPLVYTLKNTHDLERKYSPLITSRDEFPMPDIHEMWITIVDPSLSPYKGPDEETLAI